MPVERRRQHSRTAARLVSGLFDWLSIHDNPTQALLDALNDPTGDRAQEWSALVRGHAMDLWSDDAEHGLAWHQGFANGVDFLQLLWSDYQIPSAQTLSPLNGEEFVLEFLDSAAAQAAATHSASAPQDSDAPSQPSEYRLLTMDDVTREIDALSTQSLAAFTRALVPTLGPDPASVDIPRLSLSTGLWLGLAVGGRLTRVRELVLASDDLGWAARLTWPRADQGQGPTGDRVPLD